MNTNLPTHVTAEGGVDDWRFQQLLAAGWPEQQAVVLAANHDVDLHQACELLDRGCDADLAWQIVF